MSRIGKKPILIPQGVTVEVSDRRVVVSGPAGTLTREIHPALEVKVEDNVIRVFPRLEMRKVSALWGLTRTLLANMVEGAGRNFEKKLEFEGIGYRAAIEGGSLVMQVGFTHPVTVTAPPGIRFSVEKNVITVTGPDKELVGQVAARIRAIKPPEPYKGKGIRYQGERIRRKAGKRAAGTGG